MRKVLKRLGRMLFWLFFIFFATINIIAYNHAYNFTHFATTEATIPTSIEELTLEQKIKYFFYGVQAPRPQNDEKPLFDYQTVTLKSGSGSDLEAWLIPQANAKATVVLFHGYTNVKSHFLEEAYAFKTLGYNTLLVDFQGHGGSTNNFTSIGHFEALDVLAAYNFAQKQTKKVILYGVSMGAVATLKAVSDFQITPSALLLECPYESMLEAVRNRFDMVGVPSWGLAEILVFWGGVQNGYWAFDLDCKDFAKNVNTPTLLMYGLEDKRVAFREIENIYENLNGTKKLKTFENVGHSSYYRKHPKTWLKEIKNFLALI